MKKLENKSYVIRLDKILGGNSRKESLESGLSKYDLFKDVFYPRNWYASFENNSQLIDEVIDIYISTGNIHKAEEVLIEYYSQAKNIDVIFNLISVRNPLILCKIQIEKDKWNRIFELIIDEHYTCNYEKSIPLILEAIDEFSYLIYSYTDKKNNYDFEFLFSNYLDSKLYYKDKYNYLRYVSCNLMNFLLRILEAE